MSKRIVSIAIVAAFALIGGWNIYQNQTSTALPDITLSNIEALARGEGDNYSCKSTTKDIVCCWACKGKDKVMGEFYWN